jgi:hypothetical protein
MRRFFYDNNWNVYSRGHNDLNIVDELGSDTNAQKLKTFNNDATAAGTVEAIKASVLGAVPGAGVAVGAAILFPEVAIPAGVIVGAGVAGLFMAHEFYDRKNMIMNYHQRKDNVVNSLLRD